MKPLMVVHGLGDGRLLKTFGKRLEAIGHDVKYYEYEKRSFWSYWFTKNMRDDGRSLLHDAGYESGMDVIAHSNGQLVVQLAIQEGARFGKVFIFSGAGTSDNFVWPSYSMQECHWFVNTKDKAVLWGALIPKHPFGKAARVGYAGVQDPRHKNHKYVWSKWFNNDHSFWFVEMANQMLKIIDKTR
tara:strand:+ start:2438 stop:2995 length:558 start_codon:yes stop_codon:yes gene_type:complete